MSVADILALFIEAAARRTLASPRTGLLLRLIIERVFPELEPPPRPAINVWQIGAA